METNPFILVRSAGLPLSILSSLIIDESIILNINEEQWASIKNEHLTVLLNFSKSNPLQNGLLYSSHSFINRIDQLHTKKPHQYRKKEFQTIRRLTQYLGRISGKTVPFSSFSTISLLNSPLVFESKQLLNTHVLQKIIEDEEIVILNPTFRSFRQEFVWFSLKIQDKINISPKEEFLSMVIEFLKNDNSIEDLSIEISKKHGLEQNEILSFINQLIESEILVLKSDIDFENANRITKNIISNQNIDQLFINQLYNRFIKQYPSLDFPKERLFYEHQCIPRDLDIQNEGLSPIKTQLNSLYKYLYSKHKDELNQKLLKIWNLLEIQDTEIEFIDFYQQILTSKTEIPSIEINYDYQLKTVNKTIQITLPSIETTTPSFGAICQIFSQNGYKSYLNNFTVGYGKYYGRFTPLLDDKLLDYIKEKNKNSKYNLVSNKNFQTTNVDLHPKIIPSEIDFSQSIKIKKSGDTFELYQNEIKIKIMDLSIEHPKFKSIRYQLLNLFGFPNISKNGIIRQISSEVEIKTNYGKYIPSLEYNDIILQRETWIIHLDHLVNPNIKSKFQYFEAIQKWKSEIGITECCYVSSIDHPKLIEPQLIHFNSPHFVELFKSISRKVSSQLVFEKMTPSPEQLLGKGEESFLHEFLIEFGESVVH